MDITKFTNLIAENFLRVQKHPTEELYIYNYTAKTQYDRMWNEITLACRGLILDAEGRVVARPFPKFFNIGELETQVIPALPFKVYEKMDGSLGISYTVNGEVFIATRGSFISEQSVKATELLNTTYKMAIPKMNADYTYLFEIIYPENRIVVDYGNTEALILLGVIDTQTGKEMPLEDIGFPIVKIYDGIEDVHDLKALEIDNKEGFVIKFDNDFRLKVKFAEYFRLHRIITNVTSYNIWEYLKSGQPLDEILEQVPDEFFNWAKATKKKLESEYTKVETQAKSDFKILETRKETAEYFKTCKYPGILFSMLDEKKYETIIWKIVKPDYCKPWVETQG